MRTGVDAGRLPASETEPFDRVRALPEPAESSAIGVQVEAIEAVGVGCDCLQHGALVHQPELDPPEEGFARRPHPVGLEVIVRRVGQHKKAALAFATARWSSSP